MPVGDVVARYTPRPGGLNVRFAPPTLAWIPFVWANSWIPELADGKYLWILSREPSLSASVYAKLQEAIRAQGFDPGRLKKTPHSTA
jgi:apolipoprotein D and lipocalin family protein